MSKSLIFIDTRVANYQTLIACFPAGSEVVLINGGNGLQQMSDALAGRTGIEAIHVFSHGSAGVVQLGDTTLNSANLNTYAPLLAQIGQSLSAEGDLLLYGCNVAQGEAGQAFVESIARVTQADVAASEDLTGAAALGGDWVLEVASGAIETAAIQASSYNGALAFSASLVADIWNEPGASQQDRSMAILNNVLYFNARDSTTGQELWKYDGTNPPSRVADIYTGLNNGSSPNFLTVFNNAIYFQANDGTNGPELWKYDGTGVPTMVANINPTANQGGFPTGNQSTGKFTEFNGALYFTASNGTANGQLYKFDGSSASLVATINPGGSAMIDQLTVFNGALYFQANNGAGGQGAELWKYDGTTTTRITDINPGSGSSTPSYLTVFNGALYFQANDNTLQGGTELWKYDGTTATMININTPDGGSSTPSWMTVFNGALYFQAVGDSSTGAELWKYDGTTATMVQDINPGVGNGSPSRLAVFDNALYFSAIGSSNEGAELWKYDGTTATVVANINTAGLGSSSPTWLTPFNGGLNFWANDGTGKELWQYKSDNANPTISDVTNQTINEGANTGALAFTITDAETAVASLTLAGSSSNTTFIPNGNIVFGGSDGNRTVTVTPAANGTGVATVTLTVSDGSGGTATDTFTVTVNDVDPVISNATFSVAENSANGTAVGTVTATNDTNGLTYAITGGNTGTAFAINSSGQITVADSTQLNYESTSSYTLTVAVDDEDADATADSTATITVNLTDVNDAPVNTKPGAQTTNEDTALVFSSGNSNALSVTDDDPGTTLTTVVSVASGKGTLAVTTGGGGTITGDGSNAVQIVGTVAQVQNALGSVTYTPTANASGAGYATLTIQSTDNGAGTLSDTDTVTLNVTSIADTPSVTSANTTPSTQSTSGLVLTRNAADSTEVTHFKVTGITNGNLFKTDGTTAISNGDFITFAEGNAGLKFTPTGGGNGSFTAQASTSNVDGGLGGSTVNATIAVGAAVVSPTVNEDTDSGVIAITLGGSETHYKITSINGGTLYSDSGYTTPITNGSFIASAGATTNVYFRPTANNNSTTGGNGSFVVQASTSNADGGLTGSQLTSTVTLTAVADTPSVTNATTNEDTQSASGLVLSRNAADGAETTHFKITGINGGTLYKNDGTTEITNNTFITFAEGNAGLKFTPMANSISNGGFNVEASTNGTTVAGSAATATVTVNAVADTPSVASPTITEDNDSAAIAITRNAADGAEMTHYKVTGITGGTLFSDAGFTTQITNGSFIASGGGTTNVYFRPTANSNTAGHFTVQASTSNADGGLGCSTASSAVTITSIADTPSVTNANTTPGSQSTSGLVLTRNVVDGNEVTHFKITGITNGNLFKNDGTTAIANGTFITFAEGNAGLKFTPTAGNGSFTAQASKSNGDGGLGGSTVNATISVNSAPTITSNAGGATATINMAENSTAVTTVVATDVDAGQTLVYSISGGADAAKFGINSTTGALTFVSAPDFETPTDSDFNNAYLVNITANDGNGGTDQQAITVVVTDIADGGGFTATGNENKTINNPVGNVTIGNTGTGTVTVTGVDNGATVSTTGSGNTTVSNPDGGVTIANTGTGLDTVTGLLNNQTVTTTGSGNTTVSDPAGNLTLHNTGTGTVTATSVNTGATVTTTGTSAADITNPDGNVTINNTGTGVTTITGTTAGSTLTTQGTGPVVVNSVLTAGNTITIAAASNTNLTVDNDNTGAVNVTGVTNGSTINSTGSGTGTTSVTNPTGNLSVNNTGSNTVTVTGLDTNKTLTAPGSGPVTVDNPDGNLFLNNSGSGTITVTSINVGNSITTSGSGPVSVSAPDGNVSVINNGTGLTTVSGAPNGATVNCTGSGPQTINLSNLTAGQSVTIDNDGSGLVNLINVPFGVTVSFTGTGPTTVSSFSGNTGNGPVVLENLSTSLVTVVNDASGLNGAAVSSSGTGPIKFDTDITAGQSMTVNIADNTNVTFDNDGTGTVNVTGATNATTITSSSSGPMTVSNPTGNLTVNNSANGTLNVTGFDNDKTLILNTTGATTVTSPDGNLTVTNTGSGTLNVTALVADKTLTTNASATTTVTNPAGNLTLVNNGTGSIAVDGTAAGGATLTTASSQNISVTNPGGNLTVANTGTGTVSVSGLNNNATLNATGTGATTLTSPDADASLTVNNTGTGLVSVSGIADGKTITTQGTGQIAINSALGTGQKINVDSTANNDIQITNSGAGQVDVLNNLALDTNDAMNFSLTGNSATIVNLTGTLDLGNAPLTLNLASGYTPAVGHTITLIANDSNDAITGTFAGKTEGSTVQVGNYLFTISYAGGSNNNDVVLTMTGTASSGGGGGGAPTPTQPPVITNPDGTTTVVTTTPTGEAIVTAPSSGSTISTSGSNSTTITHPGSTVILNNTGTGIVTTTGMDGDTKLNVTGTGTQRVDISGMKPGDVLTINNTGTGTVDLSSLPDGVIVKLLGNGPVTLNDSDGATPSVENKAPALGTGAVGDGNGDGTPDALQSNVASVSFLKTDTAQTNPTASPPVFVSLIADAKDGKIDTADAGSATLENVKQLDAPASLPASVKMPLGLISFDAKVSAAGTTETFSLYVDPTLGINAYLKKAGSEWVNLASSEYGGKVVTEGGKTRLDFKITDGGIFDSDGKADGVITDPGAPGSIPLDIDNDQFPDALEAANGLKVGTRDNDVFGNSKYFAMQLYRDILGREGDSGGVQHWQGQIDSSLLSRAQVASSFLASAEFQGGAGGITRLYLGAMNRLPDSEGMANWMGQSLSGTSLTQIGESFAVSAEFASIYGKLDNSTFINKLYQNTLNRSADVAGATYWNTQLDAGISRGTVLSGFTESAEGKAALNTKVSVTLDYIGLLGRTPEQTGFDGWVQQQDTGTPEIEVIGSFMASTEYHGRFLP